MASVVWVPGGDSAVDDAVTSISWSHEVLSDTNSVLMVYVGTIENSITDVTYGGVSLTFKQVCLVDTSIPGETGPARIEEWYMLEPPVGTDTIEVTISPASDLAGGSNNYHNVDAADPFGTSLSVGHEDVTEYEGNLSDAETNSMLVSAITVSRDTPTSTPPVVSMNTDSPQVVRHSLFPPNPGFPDPDTSRSVHLVADQATPGGSLPMAGDVVGSIRTNIAQVVSEIRAIPPEVSGVRKSFSLVTLQHR